jgi:hypothetical protein
MSHHYFEKLNPPKPSIQLPKELGGYSLKDFIPTSLYMPLSEQTVFPPILTEKHLDLHFSKLLAPF